MIGLAIMAGWSHDALANAGTPLMWMTGLHLLLGNALLGVGEGLLLAWLLARPRGKCVLVMIGANYCSSWIGSMLVSGMLANRLPMDLTNGWQWFWVMVVVMYGLTLVVELPFVAWCCRGEQDWLRRSVWASLVVQTTSYLILFGGYAAVSGTTLYTDMRIVAPTAIALPNDVTVYFIDADDGNVYARKLGASQREKIYDLHSTHHNDRLFVRHSEAKKGMWDIVARLEPKDPGQPTLVTVLPQVALKAVPLRPDRDPNHTDQPGTWFKFGKAPVLGDPANEIWDFSAGFWAIDGLRATKVGTQEVVKFSYDTPFGGWAVRNAVSLMSKQALFQLGWDQICVFDPATRRIALLWRGRGPIAVIGER